MQVEVLTDPTDKPEYLAKTGMQFRLPGSKSKVEWYGMGPHETYPDRQSSGQDRCFPENGRRTMGRLYRPAGKRQPVTDHDWVSITDTDGYGLRFSGPEPMNFSAYSYSDADIAEAKHTWQLEREDFITFNIDHRQSGLGTATCGPGCRPAYLLPAQKTSFSLTISPVQPETKDQSLEKEEKDS